MLDVKTMYFNQHITDYIFSKLAPDLSCEKSYTIHIPLIYFLKLGGMKREKIRSNLFHETLIYDLQEDKILTIYMLMIIKDQLINSYQ